MYKPTTILVRNEIPVFIRENFEDFERFMLDYFDSLCQDGEALQYMDAYLDEFDSSNEGSKYWESILADLGWKLGVNLTIPNRQFVCHLREYYLARGSIQSLKFLFRLFWNDVATVKHPRDEMLVCSESEFSSDSYMYVEYDFNSVIIRQLQKSVDNFELICLGLTSGSYANIENMVLLEYGGVKLMRFQITHDKDFTPNETIRLFTDSFSFDAINMPTLELLVDEPKDYYVKGERLTSDIGLKPSVLNVSKSMKGSIKGYEILNAGTGYAVGDRVITPNKNGFFAVVSKIGGSGDIIELDILNAGYNIAETQDLIVYGVGQDAYIRSKSNEIGRLLKLDYVEPILSKTVIDVTLKSDTFKTVLVAVHTTAKRRRDVKGCLGYNGILTDSLYYQQFSYQVSSSVNRQDYADIIQSEVHQTGYIMYSELKLTDTVSINTVNNSEIIVT